GRRWAPAASPRRACPLARWRPRRAARPTRVRRGRPRPAVSVRRRGRGSIPSRRAAGWWRRRRPRSTKRRPPRRSRRPLRRAATGARACRPPPPGRPRAPPRGRRTGPPGPQERPGCMPPRAAAGPRGGPPARPGPSGPGGAGSGLRVLLALDLFRVLVVERPRPGGLADLGVEAAGGAVFEPGVRLALLVQVQLQGRFRLGDPVGFQVLPPVPPGAVQAPGDVVGGRLGPALAFEVGIDRVGDALGSGDVRVVDLPLADAGRGRAGREFVAALRQPPGLRLQRKYLGLRPGLGGDQ